MLDTVESNTDYISVWNDILAPKFNRFCRILMEGLSFHSQIALKQIALPAGARVLDAGCGWGDTALQLAHKVGPRGSVMGLDCCDSFLQKGREDAKSAGMNNVEFLCADVQTHPFKPEYDLCFSRFGMMFFASPVVAMRNIRKALKPGAELMFIVWRRIEDNPWLGVPKQIALNFLPPPGEAAKTCGPGPFSMASQDVVTAQLKAAGYTDIRFDRVDGPVMVGKNAEEAMQFQLALGPAGEIFREAGELAERKRGEIEEALRRELARFEKNGEIIMDSSSWTIRARKPVV